MGLKIYKIPLSYVLKWLGKKDLERAIAKDLVTSLDLSSIH
jgi:hypothetical protein